MANPNNGVLSRGAGNHQMSAAALSELGQGQIAYIKPLATDAGTLWAIHAANGDPLAVLESRDIALAALRQNDLEPFGIH